MKKHLLLLFTSVLFVFPLVAQTYTTPNTGVTWTLTDIANASPTTITISGSDFTLLENLIVAENDTVIIDTDLNLGVEDALLITVFGAFTVSADAVNIFGIDQIAFEGFRFEELSQISIQNTSIEYSGGLRVLTEDFSIDNCTLTNNVEGATTSAVIQLSRGLPQITNNTITFNQLAAIGSAANSEVSAYIFNNYLEGNNQENSNRPQINLGTTRTDAPLVILENSIIGDRNLDMVGGIAVANFTGGSINTEIDGNIIRDNRYGMTILGNNAVALIRDNIFEDNDTQGNPNLGGSGISLNSTAPGMDVIAHGNEIRRNLWGITLIGEASINLGDGTTNSPGENIFSENGNGGIVYALYNNTANTIEAKNNCWVEGVVNDLAIAESVIYHQVDDATLGEVLFDPVGCGVLGVEANQLADFNFYPNPAKNSIRFTNNIGLNNITIIDLQGKVVQNEIISNNTNEIRFILPSGVYFARFTTDTTTLVKKLLVE
ncbi:T9SS type A sorting domain-containing protein [Ulvibacter antarcticus]|uniref:Putative secreted protein (Por secretion system target) n=1 Tax=Ulvibacter antarcticus TaxID=442714 RepID=A0A3L9Z348_9FLAO|nr:T9SS type A sorting domain-containing protein [Ulvibacter antarcticus]RMA66427.1 putative secreted protein (Por secretion system target) [Ulvibacter antarcticus]